MSPSCVALPPPSPAGPRGLVDVRAPRPLCPADSARSYASHAELQRRGSAPFPGLVRLGPWPGAPGGGGGEAGRPRLYPALECGTCLNPVESRGWEAWRNCFCLRDSNPRFSETFVPFPDQGVRLALDLRHWPGGGNRRAIRKLFCIRGALALESERDGLLLRIPALSLPPSHWSDPLRAQSENYVPRAIKLFTEPL